MCLFPNPEFLEHRASLGQSLGTDPLLGRKQKWGERGGQAGKSEEHLQGGALLSWYLLHKNVQGGGSENTSIEATWNHPI